MIVRWHECLCSEASGSERVITSAESKIHDKSKDARTPVGKHDDHLHC